VRTVNGKSIKERKLLENFKDKWGNMCACSTEKFDCQKDFERERKKREKENLKPDKLGENGESRRRNLLENRKRKPKNSIRINVRTSNINFLLCSQEGFFLFL
jgi:hypothetical protein